MIKNTSNDRFGFGESLPEQIAKHILQRIIKGELQAGEKIVEEEISKELKTSRAPVREALYLLQVDGIVERIPRRGTIVKSFTQNEIVEYNDVMIELIQIAVDFSQEKWQKQNQEKLREYFEEVDSECQKKNVLEYQIKAEKFLRYILFLADNKALTRFYEEANHILKVFARVKWTNNTMENFHSKLTIFNEAILNSDFEKAKTAIFETLKLGVK